MDPKQKLAQLLGKTADELGDISESIINAVLESIPSTEAQAVTLSPALEQALLNATKDAEPDKEIYSGRIVVNSAGQVSIADRPDREAVIVNSRTSGKFRNERINGRPHIVTDMVSIVGDTVMNQILYPLDEVEKSHLQLSDLPAPAGHPVVNGKDTSAMHPLAINAQNIGGMIRKPRMAGKRVINELALDLEVAEKDERGLELIKRIKNAEKVGVSTGGLAKFENATGTAPGDGRRFQNIARDIKWDHVAILLDNNAAGDHVGTQLLLNARSTGNEPIYVCNIDANQLEDNPEMTIEEMITEVKGAGHTVLLKDSPELEKLSITNEQLEAVKKMEAEKEKALNSAKEELAKVMDTQPSDYDGIDDVTVINALTEKAKETKPVSNAGRTGDSGEGGEPEKVTADSIKKMRENVGKKKE
jgi:hypothetical protein